MIALDSWDSKNLKLWNTQKLYDDLNFNGSDGVEISKGFTKGTQTTSSFTNTEVTRVKELLQIVHINVCGPTKIHCIERNRYFVIFIDDKTIYTAICLMKSKDEAL